MASSPEHTNPFLREQNSTLSDTSFGSANSTVVASPASPAYQRSSYHRVSSLAEQIDASSSSGLHQDNTNTAYVGHGLGISNLNGQQRDSGPQVPLGSKSDPNSPSFPLSPNSAKLAGKTYRALRSQSEDDERDSLYVPSKPSVLSLHQTFEADSELEDLNTKKEPADTRGIPCKMRRPFYTGRGSWLAVSTLLLAIYSTAFSGLWLMIAIKKPRYGHTITTAGGLSPGTASLLCAAFAKSIELSFVAVFVAFLGQLLTTRAMANRKKGITIAEMGMRTWVLQPGTMISRWESVRYAAATFLGVFALVTALMAMVYTTASDALVAPKLKFGNTEHRVLYGQIATSFANTTYLMEKCNTPIPAANDPENYGQTCIQIQNSGEAYHNYMQYLAHWVDDIHIGNGSTNLTERPEPVAMLYDNTTIKGSWTNIQNMTDLSEEYGRIVNNVTMAMPHSGVVRAARDQANYILQPRDLSGLGEYHIQASVPSPVVNVLCAELTEEELVPMVYPLWPAPYNNGTMPNSTTWPNDFNLNTPVNLTNTTVDDLFNFDDIQTHPIFPKIPLPFNTVFNYSNTYGQDAVYILATSEANTYTMCSLRTALTPNCSTEYHSSMSGGNLSTHCDDPNDDLAYIKSNPHAPRGLWVKDWVSVASQWGSAISLNDGISDAKSTNARLLTQLIPTTSALDVKLPSISEALAVLAGNSLLLSAIDSPFAPFWNYSVDPPPVKPIYQSFNARIRSQNYASGGTNAWQGIFYIVLTAVFITNVCCLLYFIRHGALITDFIEPQNLFSLSLNSPPSAALEGSCGGGPEKEHFRLPWTIELDKEKEHLYLDSKEGRGPIHKHQRNWNGSGRMDDEMEGSPVVKMYSKLSQKRTSWL